MDRPLRNYLVLLRKFPGPRSSDRFIKKRIGYRNYPDAFRQILGATGAQRSPCLLVTARNGYEFRYGTSRGRPGGGRHGSLKRREMLVPLIAGGTSVKPVHCRIVDLKAWILSLVDNETRKASGT